MLAKILFPAIPSFHTLHPRDSVVSTEAEVTLGIPDGTTRPERLRGKNKLETHESPGSQGPVRVMLRQVVGVGGNIIT
jgi:hypothetical protein